MAATDKAARVVAVQIPEADRAVVRGWREFFACYGLVREQSIMIATLRDNHFASDPQLPRDHVVRIQLAPSSDQPAPTPAEAELVRDAIRMADGLGRPGGLRCPS